MRARRRSPSPGSTVCHDARDEAPGEPERKAGRLSGGLRRDRLPADSGGRGGVGDGVCWRRSERADPTPEPSAAPGGRPSHGSGGDRPDGDRAGRACPGRLCPEGSTPDGVRPEGSTPDGVRPGRPVVASLASRLAGLGAVVDASAFDRLRSGRRGRGVSSAQGRGRRGTPFPARGRRGCGGEGRRGPGWTVNSDTKTLRRELVREITSARANRCPVPWGQAAPCGASSGRAPGRLGSARGGQRAQGRGFCRKERGPSRLRREVSTPSPGPAAWFPSGARRAPRSNPPDRRGPALGLGPLHRPAENERIDSSS